MNKDVYRLIYRQILYISQSGCKNIKCRKCILNKICDHFPEHSQTTAIKILTETKETKQQG